MVLAETPPNRTRSQGKADAASLVAAEVAGVDEVYAVGGMQAVAGLAYGTQTLPRVSKIVGPGSSYVSAAKRLLYGVVAGRKLTIERVAPQKWKRALAVPADKDGARARASVLLPKHSGHWPLKKHDGRAEAALIALYGAKAGAA